MISMNFFKKISFIALSCTIFFTKTVVNEKVIIQILNEINNNPDKDKDRGKRLTPSQRAVYWGFFANVGSGIYLSDPAILAAICHEVPADLMRYLVDNVKRDDENFARAYEDHLHTVEDFDNAIASFNNNDKAKCESCDTLNTFMLQQKELREKFGLLRR